MTTEWRRLPTDRQNWRIAEGCLEFKNRKGQQALLRAALQRGGNVSICIYEVRASA
jgi:hypothetical protein